MKKGFKIAYSVVFMAVCASPLALIPFGGSSGGIGKNALAEMPAFLSDGRLNTDFSTQFEAWASDRLPLRAQLLSAAGFVKGGLLHSPASNVISGKNGQLFLIDEQYDYMDTNALSPAQIRAAAVTLHLIQEHVEDAGGRFTFVPMPNKSSVYPEDMPACYQRAEENNYTRLCAQLDAAGVRYTDMLTIMTESKAQRVYHKRDTHWNQLGALIGYNAVMDSLGRPHKRYDGVHYTLEKTWEGDLDKLLYPAAAPKDYQYRFEIGYEPFVFTYPAGVTDMQAQLASFMSDREENDSDFTARCLGDARNEKLYMVRDSFGRALLPFVIDNYRTATFVRTDRPDITRAEGGDMVYEIVERNLQNIIATAPYQFAPERAVPRASPGSAVQAVHWSDEGYAIRICGVLPEDADTGDGRVCIRLTQGNAERCFEAFPILEREQFPDAKGTNGFSLYISPDAGLSGDYGMCVITGDRSYEAGELHI